MYLTLKDKQQSYLCSSVEEEADLNSHFSLSLFFLYQTKEEEEEEADDTGRVAETPFSSLFPLLQDATPHCLLTY